MELHLSQKIAERRVFPAMTLNCSGTRKDDLLMSPEEHQKTWMLRKVINPMGEVEAMEWLIDKLGAAKNQRRVFRTSKRINQ